MKSYKVRITEILQKAVELKAESPENARELAERKWDCGEYVLGAEDFKGVNFTVREGPSDGTE